MGTVLSEKDISYYEDVSNRLNEKLLAEKNENIVNYIQYNAPLQDYSNASQLENSNEAAQISTTNNDLTVINDYTFFTKLKDCGYIAAGMLLAYRQYEFGGDYIPSSYLKHSSPIRVKLLTIPNDAGPRVTVSTNANRIYYTLRDSSDTIISQSYVDSSSNTWNFASWSLAAGQYKFQAQAPGGNCETVTFTVNIPAISISLPTALYNTGVEIGYGSQTASHEIRSTVNKYLSDNGYAPVSYIDDWISLTNNARIADCISNSKHAIWFGKITENTHDNQAWIKHAIIAYGYTINGGAYNYIAHFGWPNATEVYFSGFLGSMYTCWR